MGKEATWASFFEPTSVTHAAALLRFRKTVAVAMVSAALWRSLVPGVGGLTSLTLPAAPAHFLAIAVASEVTLADKEAPAARTAKKLNQNQRVHPVAHFRWLASARSDSVW